MLMICQCKESTATFSSPLQALIITQTTSSSWRLFFVKSDKSSDFYWCFWRLLWFGDSKARITLQLGLLCSTSSGCCREPLSRPKALTGGQSLSSSRSSQSREETLPSATRLQMNRACAWPPPFPPWLTERGVNVMFTHSHTKINHCI